MTHLPCSQIRDLMAKEGIDAYWVPSTDPHQSEYVPAAWNRRAFASGFDGSAGDLIILKDAAYLWTDSRYFLQAEAQLSGSGIELMKMGQTDVPSIHEFLGKQFKGKLGIDPRLISPKESAAVAKILGTDRLMFIDENLVDRVWEDQPPLSMDPIQVHPDDLAGQPITSKLVDVRKSMEKEQVDFLVISQLDAIAWLFNIRGTDVEFNPLVVSYALVSERQAWLFVDSNKVTPGVKSHLGGQVTIAAYDQFAEILKRETKSSTVLMDSDFSSKWIEQALHGANLVRGTNPITLLKSRKNETELEGFRQCHIRDGVAMVRFFIWLEEALGKGGITEISASDRLTAFRAEQDGFQGPSFGSISGYAAHGAIVHYSATPESDVPLKQEGLYLIDSGGQYVDGTTDITRTLALGTPTDEQKDRFTRVLKGHLALRHARFPKGTCGPQLDTLARKPLWDIGLNYGHGTGHGVGSYLCVHEGPQAISYYRGAGVSMEPGMVVSNEPGFYKEGEYGIRIENLVAVTSEGDHGFMGFEDLTMCPIDRKLIDVTLLDEAERNALNSYHREVFSKLAPKLSEPEKKWLKEATAEI